MMRTGHGLLVLAAVTAAGLGGCTSQIGFSERAGEVVDAMKDPFVAPQKFRFLRCPDITARLTGAEDRAQELRSLMDRAATGTGGSTVNLLVYQPEYQSVLSELQQLKDTAAEKNCAPPPAAKPVADPGRKPGKDRKAGGKDGASADAKQ